ncbi:hypothetical protein Hanom_Chr09g00766351 [Helianthus anomalus]
MGCKITNRKKVPVTFIITNVTIQRLDFEYLFFNQNHSFGDSCSCSECLVFHSSTAYRSKFVPGCNSVKDVKPHDSS